MQANLERKGQLQGTTLPRLWLPLAKEKQFQGPRALALEGLLKSWLHLTRFEFVCNRMFASTVQSSAEHVTCIQIFVSVCAVCLSCCHGPSRSSVLEKAPVS